MTTAPRPAGIFVRDFLGDQTVHRSAGAPSNPLVSVILPTHSRRQLLQRAMDSVMAQTFTDFEFLVMDDGSRDGSAEVIEEYRARDPRIVHVRHERNSGLPGLRVNEGIELARGKFLAFQFDDDLWRPNALASLTTAAGRQPGPAVLVGRAHFTSHTGGWMLPQVELNYVNLCQENRFANNSVLVPRELVSRFGLYDCHIGMRRLCDWDLWLRYFKYVPFVLIDDTVSKVFEYNPGSIALTVPWDLGLFRFFQDIPRNTLLKLDHWRDYQIDALTVGETEFTGDIRRRLYDQHLVPYYLKFRHHFPWVEGFPATLPEPRQTVLLTKYTYDVTNDITLAHYDPVSNRRGTYKAYFQPLPQVTANWPAEADALLQVRTVEDEALVLADMASQCGKPMGYYLDDDLLNFYQFGPEFSYLAPGTPYHNNLIKLLGRADAVWQTTPAIEETVRPHNPRTVPHNNCIPQEWLPDTMPRRDPERPFRIGYAGTGYRREEFAMLWPAFQRLSSEYGDRIAFEFWGLDVSAMPALASPVTQQAFTFSYFDYLTRLCSAGFDVLLTPLFTEPRPRLAKSLIKYYESAAAGALCIFSDVPQYDKLPGGLTCLKAANITEAWYEAIKHAMEMPAADFDLMRQRLLDHVREEYTETAQVHLHEAAWHATEFHARTRQQRADDGRPTVVYVIHSAIFGGGELQMWRRLRLALRYGVRPVVVLHSLLRETPEVKSLAGQLETEGIALEFVEFSYYTSPRSPAEHFSERERQQVRALLERLSPALVHTVTFNPTFGQVCTEMEIPHVSSLYQVDEAFAWPGGRPAFTHSSLVHSDSLRFSERWADLLGAERFCSRPPVPAEVFDLGQRRHLESLGASPGAPSSPPRLIVAGTLQERKKQKEIIEAVAQVRRDGLDCQLDLYGYTHFFPDYLAECQRAIKKCGLEDRVSFRGFQPQVTEILSGADVALVLSGEESFSGVIAEAMAGGTLVVATPIGGTAELVIDEVTGILCADTTVEEMAAGIRRALALTPEQRARILEQARRVARSEFHPYRQASDLFQMYNRAIDIARGGPSARPTYSRGMSPSDNVAIVGHPVWRLARLLLRLRLLLAPPGSRRERLMRLFFSAVALWRQAGPRVALKRMVWRLKHLRGQG